MGKQNTPRTNGGRTEISGVLVVIRPWPSSGSEGGEEPERVITRRWPRDLSLIFLARFLSRPFFSPEFFSPLSSFFTGAARSPGGAWSRQGEYPGRLEGGKPVWVTNARQGPDLTDSKASHSSPQVQRSHFHNFRGRSGTSR